MPKPSKGSTLAAKGILPGLIDVRSTMPLSELETTAGRVQCAQGRADATMRTPATISRKRSAGSRYFVRVELVDSDGLILAVADSRPFRGLRLSAGR